MIAECCASGFEDGPGAMRFRPFRTRGTRRCQLRGRSITAHPIPHIPLDAHSPPCHPLAAMNGKRTGHWLAVATALAAALAPLRSQAGHVSAVFDSGRRQIAIQVKAE